MTAVPRRTATGASDRSDGTTGPERTCIGCRRQDPKSRLLRLVGTPDGVAVDAAQSAPGRGAYLHRDRTCLDLAVRRRAVARALRTGTGDAATLPALLAPFLGAGAELQGLGGR